MGLKDLAALFAAGGSVVFGWIAAQDQLCDMRLARPICIEPPAASSTPISETAPAAVPPQTSNVPAAPVPEPAPAPAPAVTTPAVQTAPQPLAVGSDLSASSSVPQAALTPQETAQFEQRVRTYLDEGVRRGAAGFRPNGVDTVVPMQPNGAYNVPVTLSAGVRYRVVGACDDDCTAIALEAYDPNGALITRSDGSGDFPVLELTPGRAGQYTMRVRLLRCAVAPCFVGVRVLEG